MVQVQAQTHGLRLLFRFCGTSQNRKGLLLALLNNIICNNIDDSLPVGYLQIGGHSEATGQIQANRMPKFQLPNFLLKLAGSIVFSTVIGPAVESFRPIQRGVGIPGGVESAIHSVQACIEKIFKIPLMLC